MKEIYRLDGMQLPTLFTPHDCIIKEIKKENDFLIFVFEEDISYHDSIPFPVKSLIIKYHLTDDYEIYYQKWNKLRKRFEYLELKNEAAFFQRDSQYIYEYVMCNQLILRLFQDKEYLLFLTADYVAYDWIEK